MSTATALAIYFLVWWVVLFAVLPWGVRNQEESGQITPGTDPGAPAVHAVWKKLFWTTIVASVVFGILAGVYALNLIPYDFLMATSTAVAIYFLVWWIVLFAVLPWGVRNQEESGEVLPGTDPGAPAVHKVWIKLVWTTVVATVVFGILAAVYKLGLIPYDYLAAISGPRH